MTTTGLAWRLAAPDQVQRLGALVVVMALVAVWPTRGLAQTHPAPLREYQVKAAFVYNFAKFIEWPDAVFTKPETPLTICVDGAGELEQALRRLSADRLVQGRPVVVGGSDDPRICQLLFMGATEPARFEAVLTIARGYHVVTVGEQKGFLEAGGIVNFLVEDERVRFAINVDEAARAGIRLSSKLLTVARIVRDETIAGTRR